MVGGNDKRNLERCHRPSGGQGIQECQVGFLCKEPNPGILPNRSLQQSADAGVLWMIALQNESAIMPLKEHARAAGTFVRKLPRHVVIGAN